MLQFSIREVLFVTGLFGASAAWWCEHTCNADLRHGLKSRDESLRVLAASLETALDRVPCAMAPIYDSGSEVQVTTQSLEEYCVETQVDSIDDSKEY